ncbi:MAG: DNA-3-methyladenine glycosylase 2 family protein, partial [Candidatus Limnocylindria bacterium]
MTRRRVALRGPLDLGRTLWPLRHGLGDRTIRLQRDEAWLAARTREGTAAVRLRRVGETLDAQAWGDGAAFLLASVPALIGEEDEPGVLVAHHSIIRELQRRHIGLRLPRTG